MAMVYVVSYETDGSYVGRINGVGQIDSSQVFSNLLIVSQEVYENWTLYRVNAARDGVELTPDFFVVYEEPSGNLISRYESPQGSGPTEPNSIQVTLENYADWITYRATADRTGVRVIQSDAQILANYKPQIRDRMEINAIAAGFGSLAEAIRWKDRVGSDYEQHGQAWDDYEAAVWEYCTLSLLLDEPPFNVFLADLDTNVPPPAAIPYPF